MPALSGGCLEASPHCGGQSFPRWWFHPGNPAKNWSNPTSIFFRWVLIPPTSFLEFVDCLLCKFFHHGRFWLTYCCFFFFFGGGGSQTAWTQFRWTLKFGRFFVIYFGCRKTLPIVERNSSSKGQLGGFLGKDDRWNCHFYFLWAKHTRLPEWTRQTDLQKHLT